MIPHQDPTYFISTGEPSGDLLASEFVEAMQGFMPQFTAHGITGPKLRTLGVIEVAAIEDLSVMGFTDVLKNITTISDIANHVVSYIIRLKPTFIMLTDYPGFHLHIAELLRPHVDCPIYMFVAPQLWAWGEGRIKRLKQCLDAVFGILPFEESWFSARGLPLTYIGTPQVNRVKHTHEYPHKFATDKPLLGIFPGSRRGEISRILPRLMPALNVLQSKIPELTLVISVAESIDPKWLLTDIMGINSAGSDCLAKIGSLWRSPEGIYFARADAVALMKRVDAAVVTSGTATLECALCGTPMAVIYVAGRLLYTIGKRLVKLPHISLVNLVANESLVKEFVQEFTTNDLVLELQSLLTDHSRRATLTKRLVALAQTLKDSPGKNLAAQMQRRHGLAPANANRSLFINKVKS